MIHHLFTLWADGHPVVKILDTEASSAVYTYAIGHAVGTFPGQLTVAAWKDGAWCGYFKAYFERRASRVEPIATPACFEPLPCPKVTPAVTTPGFASCTKDGQEVAFMALERRMRELGAEAEDYRGAGNDAMADVLTGHQEACTAALRTLREVAR